MPTNNTTLTDLDFFSIKNNLKDYLRQQAQFQDYDFDGSNMSVLLDVLAYNAYQNNFYTNMAISEMFLDSAQLRGSVVSHAKELNYLPASRSSASANLDVRLGTTATPNFIIIPAKTKFISSCGSKKFTFSTARSITVTPNTAGNYDHSKLAVYEGNYKTEIYKVNSSGARQRYTISDENVDINSIRVYVRNNLDDRSAVEEYIAQENIFGVKPTDVVFFLQAFADNKYEISFGQDTFGKQPVTGNVIVIDYRTTIGTEANGASNFSPATSISGFGSDTFTINIREQTKAGGGSERESTNSIQYFAPKSIQIQDRAITESDYEILLKRRFPEIQAVTVFGGERLSPPQYGRVIVVVDVNDADGISTGDKEKFVKYLNDRNPIGITPIVIPPEFMYLEVTTKIQYNTNRTSETPSDIQGQVFDTIQKYDTENLSDFKTTFRYSKLVTEIDKTNQHIISNDTKVRAIIAINPAVNSNYQTSFTFANALENVTATPTNEELKLIPEPTIFSSIFTFAGATANLQDNGKGVLQIVKIRQNNIVYLKKDVGTVDYETGNLSLKNFDISDYDGGEIRIYARIASSDIKPPQARITTIRDADVTIKVEAANG